MEKRDEFDSAGEALGYISLDQALLEARRLVRQDEERYRQRLGWEEIVWMEASSDPREDSYRIVVQFRRPARGLREEQTGEEEFIFGLTGELRDRQVLLWPEGVESTTDRPSAGSPPQVQLQPRETPDQPAPGQVRASAVARARAEKRGIDLAQVTGTGPGGRITRDDVLAIEPGATTAPQPAVEQAPAAPYVPPSEEALDTELAGHARRFSAFLIDAAVLFVAFLSIGLLAGVSETVGGIFLFLSFIAFLVFFLYAPGKGWSPEKRAVGIRIVRDDGSAPGFAKAILRESVGKYISISFLGLGFLWILWDPRRQGWHDKIAGTVVVRKG